VFVESTNEFLKIRPAAVEGLRCAQTSTNSEDDGDSSSSGDTQSSQDSLSDDVSSRPSANACTPKGEVMSSSEDESVSSLTAHHLHGTNRTRPDAQPRVGTEARREEHERIQYGMRQARLLASQAINRGTSILECAYVDPKIKSSEMPTPKAGSSAMQQAQLFVVDQLGYETIPSTAARGDNFYERVNDNGVIGEGSDRPALFGQGRRAAIVMMETECEEPPTQQSYTHEKLYQADEGYGSSGSPPESAMDFLPLTEATREMTPDLDSFLPAQSPAPIMPADVPMGTTKLYAVCHGRNTGIYFEWSGLDQAQRQVNGFPDARHKSSKPSQLDLAPHYLNRSVAGCHARCCQPLRKIAETRQRDHRLSQQRQTAIPPSMTPSESDDGYEAVRTPPTLDHLYEEQERLAQLVLDGYNVFYTGSAGTGKSTVLKAFVDHLRYNGNYRYADRHNCA